MNEPILNSHKSAVVTTRCHQLHGIQFQTMHTQDGGSGQHQPSGHENDTRLSSDNRNNAIPAGRH